MDLVKVPRRALCLLLVILQLCPINSAYEIPDVKIDVFTPKGFRASIPTDPEIDLFVFRGNINRPIHIWKIDPETVGGEVKSPNAEGRWAYENFNVQLKEGDVINYYVLVSTGSNRHLKDDLNFTVTGTSLSMENECAPTLTKVLFGKACGGEVIFEDNFDTLNEDVWQIEQYIPDGPDYLFVSYQRLISQPTVSVNNGTLHIVPRLQQNLPGYNIDSIYSGSLNLLSGCTRSSTECSMQASGPRILPPIVSGKVTSKHFAFTYGTVHVRAKLPQGDWLFPEILLESFFKRYGSSNWSSGIIKIASARGNRDLSGSRYPYHGSEVLYGGPVMDYTCRNSLLKTHPNVDIKWGDDFHVYSLKWTPDSIILLVDSKEYMRVEPGATGLKQLLKNSRICPDVPRDLLSLRSKMAPFDDHFNLAFGVAVGGITEFDDDFLNNGKPKPWRNKAVKARLDFWKDMDAWLPTWYNSELVIDYVKVVAL